MKYKMVYDGDHFIDSIEYDSLEKAIASAEDTLGEWACEEMSNWKCDDKGFPQPTEEQIENWDYMIYNMGVWVVPADCDGDIDNAIWTPPDELRKQIGWLLWEDYVKEYGKVG